MNPTPQSMSDLPELLDKLHLTIEAARQPCFTDKAERHISWACVDYMQSHAPKLLEYLCRATAEQAGKVDGDWQRAVIDQLVICHIYTAAHDTDPAKAINDLICWNVEVALDPCVSERAQALLDAKPTQPAAPKGWEAGKVYAASREVIVGTGIPMPAAPASPSREAEALVKDADRYRWWRENIDLLDQQSVIGVAYSCQIPVHNGHVPTSDLMDMIADSQIAPVQEKAP